MDDLSIPFGRISETTVERERVKQTQGKTKEDILTLLKLRRLSGIVMSKNERHHFEARKLYRSSVVGFLEECLTNTSETVRNFALQLFCRTIPRLSNKTDSLLNPILPKIFQCLRKNERKEIKLVSLHILRSFFRHTKSLSDFIESYVRLGIENPDPEIQISCCLGLNIVFDQDIGNSLFSQLAVPITNLLTRGIYQLLRTAFRVLRHIHIHVVGNDRFFHLISGANTEAIEIYRDLCFFEETDVFFSAKISDCTTFVAEYKMKRRNFYTKDFGIFEANLLDRIQETQNCKRATAVYRFAVVFKKITWKEEDLHLHLMDFLKLINALINDPNRVVQINGYKILKELINKTGFVLSLHIRWVVDILRQGLASPNPKIISTAKRVLCKLMRNTHPMTVIWELLNVKDISLKKIALTFIQDKLYCCFSYYELDMVALCNYFGYSLEDRDRNLAKCSKDCIVILLDIMRECPVSGLRTEAVRTLLKNHELGREALKDIGILENNGEDNYEEGFELYSDEETTDFDSTSIPTCSTSTNISLAVTHRSTSTVGESETVCNAACSNVNLTISQKSICGGLSHLNLVKNKSTNRESSEPLQKDADMELNSLRSIQIPTHWQKKTFQAKTNTFVQSPDTFSVKESVLFSETESSPSRCFSRAFGDTRQLCCSKQWAIPSSVCQKSTQESPEIEEPNHGPISITELTSEEDAVSADDLPFQNETQFPNAFVSENVDVLQKIQPVKKSRCLTPFRMQKETDCSSVSDENFLDDTRAGGDVCPETYSKFNLNSSPSVQEETNFTEECYGQDDVEMDVLNKNFFNFNIMQLEDDEDNECIDEDCDAESTPDETYNSSSKSNKVKGNILKMDKKSTSQKIKTFREYSDDEATTPETRNGESTELCYSDWEFQNKTCSQRPVAFNLHKMSKNNSEIRVKEMEAHEKVNLEALELKKVLEDGVDNYADMSHYITSENQSEENLLVDQLSEADVLQEVKSSPEVSLNHSEENVTPFVPKNRQLPRTPVEKKKQLSLELGAKRKKKGKKCYDHSNKEKTCERKDFGTIGFSIQCEDTENSSKKSIDKTTTVNGTGVKTCAAKKYNSPVKWGGCHWKRELEYAAKAASCPWAEKFETVVNSMKPFPCHEAESEMKKAIDDLYGNLWVKKEAAMLNIIRLAKYHPELVHYNTAKIVLALSNEINNFRKSVAGKAILTTGYLYEIMGKNFESNLRLIVAALLAKSGNRTLAAYFRLVIKSLFKITASTSSQKALMAFIHQGSKHSTKAARETAAQFIAILTERLGPENSLSTSLCNPVLKCAAMFVTDCSALTRYCGKRMFKVLMQHPEFERMKDHQLPVNTIQDIAGTLEQIKEKDIREEILPINIID